MKITIDKYIHIYFNKMRVRRLVSELGKIQNDSECGVKVVDCRNLDKLTFEISGLKDTIWENGKFILEVRAPDDYPFSPPNVKFISSVYHPNVSESGQICLDILHGSWTPTYTLKSLLVSIILFLETPNIEHGLNQRALEEYKSNRTQYNTKVRESIIKSSSTSE